MSEINEVLDQRGKRYGVFKSQAQITQDLKENFRCYAQKPTDSDGSTSLRDYYEGWHRLDPDQREALDMIASKIARILNGDPNYDDNWIDIAGYATLVAKRLQGQSL